MVDTYARIQTMRDMFLYSQNLCSWCFDPDYQLLYSNCELQSFFYNAFLVSSSFDKAKKHFDASSKPIILSDKMGIAWISACQQENGKITAFHLLGPFFTVEKSENYLYQLCMKLHVSNELINDFMDNLRILPTIPLNAAINYSIMLYYCATGDNSFAEDVSIHVEDTGHDTHELWYSLNWHGTWEAEQKLFQQIQDGNDNNILALLNQFSAGNIGRFCEDPLRQAKDETIVFVTLCSRAAILGGVSPEGSYNLADLYLQKIEASEHISEVQNYSLEMLYAFLRRSKQAKKNHPYSIPITAAMEYIEDHLGEKVNLDALAQEIGYASYYLSNKFQKEVGISITNYIQKRKIETAMEMLQNPHYTITDVSEHLAFSSPSYFSSIFRKYAGMTPGDFVKKNMTT